MQVAVKGLPKPRLRKSGLGWRCWVPGEVASWRIGLGVTPRAAYDSWLVGRVCAHG